MVQSIPLARMQRRSSLPDFVEVEGRRFVVPVGVFNPKIYGSGLFARYLVGHRELIGRPGSAPIRALDLCSGSGVLAVTLAGMGAKVVAADINPDAVWTIDVNARLNGVEDRVDARVGDLWAAVEGETFDLITCNPPWVLNRAHLRGMRDIPDAARTDLDREPSMFERALWAGPEGQLLRSLGSRMAEHLTPTGIATVQLGSQEISNRIFLDAAEAAGMEAGEPTWGWYWQKQMRFPIYVLRQR